jgi:hypothetical protein
MTIPKTAERKDKEEKKRHRKEQSLPEEPKKKQRAHSDAAVQVQRRPLFCFDYTYILAPMVGASELAFRLLCRKYGAQLAYTPMVSVTTFSSSQDYQAREFETISEDQLLICHFSANNPTDFARAAKLAEPQTLRRNRLESGMSTMNGVC